MMQIDKNKTIEELENDYWGSPPKDASYVIITSFDLRKKKIKDLTVEDLRLLIGQNVALKYLIPSAIEILKVNPLVEGNFYEGDLLNSILTSDKKYWNDNPDIKKEVINIFEKNKKNLENLDTTEDIKNKLIKSYGYFQ